MLLSLEQHYEIVETEGDRGPWKCSIKGYQYTLDDPGGHEIVAYHWHPDGISDHVRPHVHIGMGARVDYPQLITAHLPTNRISVEDFLLLSIRDLGVEPLREEWESMLEESRGGFEDWQTWPKPGQGGS
jgi:hypothetical protein